MLKLLYKFAGKLLRITKFCHFRHQLCYFAMKFWQILSKMVSKP
ncbi:hypothetical protein AO385_1094 [Moraxella catarrhalis]|uniref:Uncharacterized protein n=1 Tax=Moraxella catarrhalis TaxID=480 RepID=A0A198XLH8_MORCA|nr:hypothetical protein AO384_1251 [Moraxella catarrhalis]OAU97396.1 hypothetical protein AO383_0956 [Moraxella catarrhalis]OAV01066.1 hypothetical protein AO385_1094 [Moraxella catarrhalis]OAV11293.1 hypothetical protein AO377_0458 [Moraxella catarrhalis]OAV13595.1 hypothetical protein AO375_1465 [Moraxella catarrhalis]